MKILYLHGIGSGAGSNTPTQLGKDFPEAEILAPELPIDPEEAFGFLRDKYWGEPGIELVIGTSLGGFYALTMPLVKKILVNPAMFADEDILHAEGLGLGTHRFLRPRSDGSTEYVIDENFINKLAKIRRFIYDETRDDVCPDKLDHNLINETYAMFGTKDTVVSHYDDFCRLFDADHAVRFGGAHHLETPEIHKDLAPLVKKVLETDIPNGWFFGE